jgi:hypothetical protein
MFILDRFVQNTGKPLLSDPGRRQTTTHEHRLLPGFRPTTAQIHHGHGTTAWSSRDHRKGRHAPIDGQKRHKIVWLNFDIGNISWWVGMLFTLGSIVWCINGFFVFLPLARPTMTTNEAASAWSAWVGGSKLSLGLTTLAEVRISHLPVWRLWCPLRSLEQRERGRLWAGCSDVNASAIGKVDDPQQPSHPPHIDMAAS